VDLIRKLSTGSKLICPIKAAATFPRQLTAVATTTCGSSHPATNHIMIASTCNISRAVRQSAAAKVAAKLSKPQIRCARLRHHPRRAAGVAAASLVFSTDISAMYAVPQQWSCTAAAPAAVVVLL
jgi:hypothetical protein